MQSCIYKYIVFFAKPFCVKQKKEPFGSYFTSEKLYTFYTLLLLGNYSPLILNKIYLIVHILWCELSRQAY